MTHSTNRRFIVVEGPLGAGKTSLAKILGARLSYRLTLEEENPFFERLFKDIEKHAFQAQLFNLLSRYHQQQHIMQTDLFQQGVLSDYLFTSEHIFAEMHLNQDEFVLYDKLLRLLDVRAPIPDLVIYLQANAETLYERLQKSDLAYGKSVPLDYLQASVEAYNSYFFHYKLSPLLVVNIDDVDFFSDDRYTSSLIKEVMRVRSGVHHFVPFKEIG